MFFFIILLVNLKIILPILPILPINKNCQYGEREVPYWLAV